MLGIPDEYKDDCDRIKAVASAKGHSISRRDAYAVWGQYSGSMEAGWLVLPDTDEEIWQRIEHIVESLTEDDEQ